MRTFKCEQGSAEWHALRMGLPTASSFHKIITPARCEPSTQARAYMFELVAEKLLGVPAQELDNLPWIQRGKDLEPEAARAYEFQHDLSTEPVGFITNDAGTIGASPDRLVISDAGELIGAVELKCPAPHTHIAYWADGFGADYRVQVQGQMYVTGLDWIDRCSYHPMLPMVCVRTHRDDEFIGKLATALNVFVEQKEALAARLRATGFFEAAAQAVLEAV